MNENELKLMAVAKIAASKELDILTDDQKKEIQKDVSEMMDKLVKLNAEGKIKGLAVVVDLDDDKNDAIQACCGFGVSTARNVISMGQLAAVLVDELFATTIKMPDPLEDLLAELFESPKTTDKGGRKLDS